MDNLIISNPKNLESIKKKIINGGLNNFHVLSDFDGTLTYEHDEKGKLYPSLISVLRDGDYISKEYAEKAHELARKNKPLENDDSIPLEERKKAMTTWWNEHFELLKNSGLNKKHLEKIINLGVIRLRKGSRELINYLHKKYIPLIIISSSGVGEAIKMYLKKENLLYENVYIITNSFNWTKEGDMVNVNKPVIHSLNKDETVLKDFPEIYKK